MLQTVLHRNYGLKISNLSSKTKDFNDFANNEPHKICFINNWQFLNRKKKSMLCTS